MGLVHLPFTFLLILLIIYDTIFYWLGEWRVLGFAYYMNIMVAKDNSHLYLACCCLLFLEFFYMRIGENISEVVQTFKVKNCIKVLKLRIKWDFI